MLPKASRIRATEFPTLLGKTRSIHGRLLSISYTSPDSTISGKFAVVAPKSIAKLAVDRNKLRRRVYAILREYKDAIAMGVTCMLFLKKEAKNASRQEIKDEIQFLLKKATILS